MKRLPSKKYRSAPGTYSPYSSVRRRKRRAPKANPLLAGWSRETMNKNIANLIRERKPRGVAIKAAYESARDAWRKAYPRKRLPTHLQILRKRTARRNPVNSTTKEKVVRAAKLYKDFHGEPPKKIRTYKKPNVDVGMRIGRIVAIMYDADHGERYVHKFTGTSRPWLISSHDGNGLAIVGGRFKMTGRGIVDK